MHEVKIKPLSVNEAWQGKRFKTKAHKHYRQALDLLLPKKIDVPSGDILLVFEIGVSNLGFDLDNALKPFIDALQDKYSFNDRRVTAITAKKAKVKRGDEFIKFELRDIDAFKRFMEALDW